MSGLRRWVSALLICLVIWGKPAEDKEDKR